MAEKPTYEELEYRLKLLENEARWRKEAEDALKESEERFKLLYEFAPDMYVLFDPQGILIDANRAAEKISGYSRQELVGKNLLSVRHSSRRPGDQSGRICFIKFPEKYPPNPRE